MVDTKREQSKNTPLAIIAGDIHYSLSNLELADNSTRQAISKANTLGVPFIANGDTTDTKANLRAECVNSMIETFKLCKIKPYVNIGNHCLINNRSKEHALNFLAPYAHIVDTPTYISELKSFVIPYNHDVEALRDYLKTLPKGARLIMHQGLEGSNIGDYVKDDTALRTKDLKDFRTILSHYHARQDIQCGPIGDNYVGLASYVGSPFSQTFGEANDPEKGFQTLYSDGTLEFTPTHLRRHLVHKIDVSHGISDISRLSKLDDLIWVKLTGTKEELLKYDRQRVAKELGLTGPFKLDLIPTDTKTEAPKSPILNQNDLLDSMIDSLTDTTDERKSRLKSTWKDLL